MPFKFTRGLLRRGDKPEPARKPILDEQPKPVPEDVYSLPTLEDLPEMPQPLEEAPSATFGREPELSPEPNPAVEQLQRSLATPQVQPQALERAPPRPAQPVLHRPPLESGVKGQVSEILDAIRRMESFASLSGKSDQTHDQILGLLTGIDRRLADVDRRLALLERSMTH